jgi:WD40 repeat protein
MLRTPLTTSAFAALFVTLNLASAGCGQPGADPESASSASESKASAATANAPEGPSTTPPAGPPIPEPTAEQLARWTPPAFAPLELLALREWKKTSFTSHIAAAPNNRLLVVGSRVLLWSLTGDDPEHVYLDLTAEDHDRDLTALAVAPDGAWFAVGDSNGMLRIFSLAGRSELFANKIYGAGVQHVAISPDGEELATIAYDGVVTLWTANLKEKSKFKVDSSGVERIEYVAPNLLAAAGENSSLWNTSTGAKVRELSPGRYNFALARTPDGHHFIHGAEDSLQIWNTGLATPKPETLRGVAGNVRLAVSPDGKLLATTNGTSVALWSLAERRCLQVIDGFGSIIVGVAWLQGSNLLAIASDSGLTRIWGTADQGATVGLKPLYAQVAKLDPKSRNPATPPQLEQMIDWHKFPMPPDFTGSSVGVTDLNGKAPMTIDELRSFYGHFLMKAGWRATTDANNPTSISFDKDGASIYASFYDAGDGQTTIFLHHAGNYDLRWTPKFDGAPVKVIYESATTSSYRTKADLLTLESWLLENLPKAGWTAYARLNTSHSEQPDARDLEFINNGATLHVSIGKFPDDTPDSHTIGYSLFPNNSWAPVPPDSGFVEFDGSTAPKLFAITAMNLDQAREFYERELAALGWLPAPFGRTLKPEHNWLSYLRGQCDMTVGLVKQPDGRTLVRIGDAVGSLWEQSQPKEDDQAEAEVDDAAPSGLEAADFPVLNESKSAKYDELGNTIELEFPGSTLANVAEIYTKALTDLGWKADDGGIRDEEYTFFDFTKDDQEISLRARKQDDVAIVSFEGDGLRWAKSLPGGKKRISFETWLRLNKLPPDAALVERYKTEMSVLPAP